MLNTKQIVQTGDAVLEPMSPASQTDEILGEMKNLYLGRCKALQENNDIAVDLFNRQIAGLRAKLARI